MKRYEQYLNKTFDARYNIKSLIGIGGMAYVFKAEDIVMHRTVAVKILNDEYKNDTKAVKRFINESKAVSMLSHPNIVKIYDVAIENDIKYIVMEYIDGITLKEYIDTKHILAWKEAVYYTKQILSALEHAHSKNIIHRDMKPQNVMLTKDGIIKVTDFGIAKIPTSESITMTDKAIGTVNYISPEQASGKPVGFYSDIYSVGVMLYEMTSGTLPFTAESPVAVAMMQINDTPKPVRELNPNIPCGLEQIILKSMEKDPVCRFSSCKTMAKALEVIFANPETIFTDHSHDEPKKRFGITKFFDGKSAIFPVVTGITLAFFVVAIISAAVILYNVLVSGKNDTSSDILIPNLVGQIYSDDLIEDLKNKKFNVLDIKYVSLSDKEVGEITSQDPEADSIRKLDAEKQYYDLTLTVNKGPDSISLPNCALTDYREAKIDLENLGLECEIVQQYDDTVLDGYVIKTSPEAGDTVTAGDKITIYVSKGKEIKTVLAPAVVGMSLDEAKRTLTRLNIKIGDITYEESSSPEGTVIKSSLSVGQTVYENLTKANLTVSLGKKETTPPEDRNENNPDTNSDMGNSDEPVET